MLVSISIELQRQHEKMDTFTILLHLHELYREHSKSTKYKISKELFRSIIINGTTVKDACAKDDQFD